MSTPLGHYLFSQDANPQRQISKDATEKRVARTVARYRSGMDGYALRDHLSKQVFSVIGGYFENFARSVGSISEETYFQQAIYFSCIWAKFSIGDLVQHQLFDYRRVIVGVDATSQPTEGWYEAVARSRPPKDQPWYHVLVNGADTKVIRAIYEKKHNAWNPQVYSTDPGAAMRLYSM